MSSLSLTEFKITSAICEVRYSDAYKIWDNAGKIWSSCEKKWTTLKPKKAEPNITTFLVNENVELSAQINKAYVSKFFPSSSLKDFIEDTSNFFGILLPILEVNEITRIGFRLTFSKNFKDQESANSYLAGIKELNFNNREKVFGIEPKIITPSYAVRFDGDTLGVLAKINLVKKELDIDIPPDISDMKSISKEYHQLVIDYDYYTLKPAKIGQINISEWIELAFRSVKRDHEHFWKALK